MSGFACIRGLCSESDEEGKHGDMLSRGWVGDA